MPVMVDENSGGDEPDAKFISDMTAQAQACFSTSCPDSAIKETHIVGGARDIVALFLVESGGDQTSSRHWVIVGDVPALCRAAKRDESPRSIIEAYCDIIDEWISAMLDKEKFDGTYPVAIPAVAQTVDELRYKIEFLREHVIPSLRVETLDELLKA